jgi:4'-phosphopantetheinyl transferase
MDAPGWLSQRHADVPAGDGWLGERERAALAGLHVSPRRMAWRLGRWTAKTALGAWMGLPPEHFEVVAAPDGAPEAWLGGERLPLSVSLSHRGDRALATVVDSPRVVGCDLELIEPRSEAFVRGWLSPGEQELVASAQDGADRALLANLIWTAKEAAAKALREGLRLDVRQAIVTVERLAPVGEAWHRLRVDWSDARTSACGWWRAEQGWVMSVVESERGLEQLGHLAQERDARVGPDARVHERRPGQIGQGRVESAPGDPGLGQRPRLLDLGQ